MNKKFFIILFALFILLDIGLAVYYITITKNTARSSLQKKPLLQNKQSDSTFQSTRGNKPLPNIDITDVSVRVNQNTIIGQFRLTNTEKVSISGISIITLLEKEDTQYNSLELIDENIKPDFITLKPLESKIISFQNAIPPLINNGAYILFIRAVNKTGLPVGQNHATLDILTGENKFVEMNWKNSSLIHHDEEFPPLAGPVFKSNENPKITLTVKNLHDFSITMTPHVAIYQRTRIANSQPSEEYDDLPVFFPARSEKKLTFFLPAYEQAESYLASVRFFDHDNKHILSGHAYFRWIMEGPAGKIISLKTTARIHQNKTLFNIASTLVGPPDTTKLDDVSLKIKLFSDKSKKHILGETIQSSLNIDPQPTIINTSVSFPSKLITAQSIFIQAQLVYPKQNRILHTTEEEVALTIERTAPTRLVITMILIIAGVFIVGFMIFLRLKKKHAYNTMTIFFLIFLSSVFFLFDPWHNTTFAGTDMSCAKIDPFPTYCNSTPTVDYSAYMNSEIVRGDSITIGGWVVITYCNNSAKTYSVSISQPAGIVWNTTNPPIDAFGMWETTGTTNALTTQPGIYTVTVTQTATLTESHCFQDCANTFTTDLSISIKRDYFICGEKTSQCKLTLPETYASIAECNTAQGVPCYEDLNSCDNNCKKPTDVPVITPTLEPQQLYLYTKCDANKQCIILSSKNPPPPNECDMNSDCDIPKHTECQSGSCVQKNGAGANQCANDDDCVYLSCDGAPVCKKLFGVKLPDSCNPQGASCGTGWSEWNPSIGCNFTSQTRSCNCSGSCCQFSNGCSADFDGPAGECTANQNRTVCLSQAPNNTPDITSVTQPITNPTYGSPSTNHDGKQGDKIQSLDVAVLWKFQEGDNGCSKPWGFAQTGDPCSNASQVNKFTVRIYDPSGNIIETKEVPSTGGNGNKNYSVNTTKQKIKTAGNYTVDVCANNGFGERCYSETHNGQRLLFTKIEIPKKIVKGNIYEHFNSDPICAVGINNAVNLELKPSFPVNYLNSSCTFTTVPRGQGILLVKTAFTCTIKYDNVTYDLPTENGLVPDYLNQKFTLQMKNPPASQFNYNEKYYCIDKNTCQQNLPADAFLCIDGNNPKSNVHLEFDQNDPNPISPTEPATELSILFDILNTGVDASNYYKLKNTQYRRSPSTSSNIYSPIPANPLLYDADDNGGFWFSTGQSGTMTSPFDSSAVTIGSGVYYGSLYTGTADFSFKNWKSNHSTIFNFTPATFIELVKSRKKYTAFTTPPDNYNNPNIKIYMINASSEVTISDNQFNQDQIIIINGADLILKPNGAGTFNPSHKSVFFMSTGTLKFDPEVEDAYGLFMGQTVDLGATDNTPLKIKGNLISVNPINTNPLMRKRLDNQKPSLFVIFDAKPYIDLLPLLSDTSYQWNQLVP